jgi:hypothetical protein
MPAPADLPDLALASWLAGAAYICGLAGLYPAFPGGDKTCTQLVMAWPVLAKCVS